MITFEFDAQNISGRLARPVTMYGLSTDTKPSDGTANGSVFIEMDTSTIYFYDLENETWCAWGDSDV